MKHKLIILVVLLSALVLLTGGCILVPVEPGYSHDWGWHREHWHD